MASTQTNIVPTPAPSTGTSAVTGNLLVSLVPFPPAAFETMLAKRALAFPGETVLVATPDAAPQHSADSPLRILPYTVTTVSASPWILPATDSVNTYKLPH